MTRVTNFKKALEFLRSNLILCNNIAELDPSIYDNLRGSLYDEESDTYTEVYQWYLTSATDWDVEFFEKSFKGGYVFTYSDKLELYVMGVTHWGTPWDGVDIDCINDDINL